MLVRRQPAKPVSFTLGTKVSHVSFGVCTLDAIAHFPRGAIAYMVDSAGRKQAAHLHTIESCTASAPHIVRRRR